MAIVRSIRRINPLDANKNIATIGVALPLNSLNLFQGTPTTREQVKRFIALSVNDTDNHITEGTLH